VLAARWISANSCAPMVCTVRSAVGNTTQMHICVGPSATVLDTPSGPGWLFDISIDTLRGDSAPTSLNPVCEQSTWPPCGYVIGRTRFCLMFQVSKSQILSRRTPRSHVGINPHVVFHDRHSTQLVVRQKTPATEVLVGNVLTARSCSRIPALTTGVRSRTNRTRPPRLCNF
jgi:hypothetical protein